MKGVASWYTFQKPKVEVDQLYQSGVFSVKFVHHGGSPSLAGSTRQNVPTVAFTHENVTAPTSRRFFRHSRVRPDRRILRRAECAPLPGRKSPRRPVAWMRGKKFSGKSLATGKVFEFSGWEMFSRSACPEMRKPGPPAKRAGFRDHERSKRDCISEGTRRKYPGQGRA